MNKSITPNYGKISEINNLLMTNTHKDRDITRGFMKDAMPSLNYGVQEASYVIKNGKKYDVNDKNEINLRNHERENALWWLKLNGGRIEFLPEIGEENGVNMADYMYYPVNGKSYFLENKEIILEKGQIKTGKNNIYHKIEDSIGQLK